MQQIRNDKSEVLRFKSGPRFSNGKKEIYSVTQFTRSLMETKTSGNPEEVQPLLMLVPDGTSQRNHVLITG